MAGYDGKIHKGATVYSNDPDRPQLRLAVQGKVQSAISLSPRPTVLFQGPRERLTPQTIDIMAVKDPFRILKVTNQLLDKIDYELKTLEPGKHYQLLVTNMAAEGDYQGFLICDTDHPRKQRLMIRVTGRIEGKISVRPQSLLIGKLNAKQPVKNATVIVMNNLKAPFKITRLDYDNTLLQVDEKTIESSEGYTLRISPKLDAIPKGAQRKTSLKIEADADPGHTYAVDIFLVNR